MLAFAEIYMAPSHHDGMKISLRGLFADMFAGFWDPPDESCPKCRNAVVEYYDPFFFSPVRTLKGRRRLRCSSCHFIWRPSRTTKSLWEKLKHRYYP